MKLIKLYTIRSLLVTSRQAAGAKGTKDIQLFLAMSDAALLWGKTG